MNSNEMYPGRTHKKNPKYLRDTLSLLESFHKSVLGTSSTDDGLIQNASSILKFKKRWKLVISGNYVWTNLNRKYLVSLHTSNFGSITCKVSLRVSKFEHTIAFVNSFNSENHNPDEEIYYRAILPVIEEFDVSSYIQNVLYDTDGTIHYNSTKCTIQSHEFNLYFFSEEKNRSSYLIIDAKSKLKFENFKRYLNSILTALGFCTGSLFAGEAYYLSFVEDTLTSPKDFLYEQMRNSCFNNFPILRHDLVKHGVPNNAEPSYSNTEKKFSIETFSTIASTFYENDVLRNIASLIIDAMDETLEHMPPLLCVAFEALTNLIIDEREKETNPFEASDVEAIIGKLLEVLSALGHSSDSVLAKRVKLITRPGNNEKLILPFKLYDIALTQMDIKCIRSRNKYLHGGQHRNFWDDSETKFKEGAKIFFESLHLYTLICILVLKRCNYNGLIYNYPKIYQHLTETTLEEGYFRRI